MSRGSISCSTCTTTSAFGSADNITRGRNANHLYITHGPDNLDGEATSRTTPPSADAAVAARLRRSTGELTAYELAHPDMEPPPALTEPRGL